MGWFGIVFKYGVGVSMIELIVNGQACELPQQKNIKELLEIFSLSKARVAVEVGGVIVPRSQHETHQLKHGDQVEIIEAIGGG